MRSPPSNVLWVSTALSEAALAMRKHAYQLAQKNHHGSEAVLHVHSKLAQHSTPQHWQAALQRPGACPSTTAAMSSLPTVTPTKMTAMLKEVAHAL